MKYWRVIWVLNLVFAFGAAVVGRHELACFNLLVCVLMSLEMRES